MGKAFLYGSGGGLNYKIVGGTSEPSSPVENMIWINTPAAIGRYSFSAAQPATINGVAVAVGDVWIQTSTNSNGDLNVLKKNELFVYPTNAFQYDGSTWLLKTGKTYKDGAWHDWTVYLYNLGDEFTALTGGWNIEGYDDGIYLPQIPSATKNSNSFLMNAPSSYQGLGLVNPVNMTSCNTICMRLTENATRAVYERFQVRSTKEKATTVAQFAIENGTVQAGDYVRTIDVSSLTGNYYFVMYGMSNNTTVHSVWFE